MVITLKAEAREKSQNLTKLRQDGFVPAVVYGKDKESVAISIPTGEFVRVWKEAGEASAVTIELPTGKETVLIHDVTFDPVKGFPQHADFLVIDVNKPVTVNLPLSFTGESQAVKSGLGVLVKVLHEVEVEGLPKDLPHEIEVDLTVLETADAHISVADLKLPAGVTTTAEGTDLVASIAAAQEETESDSEIDFDQIQVEEKGKKEEQPTEE